MIRTKNNGISIKVTANKDKYRKGDLKAVTDANKYTKNQHHYIIKDNNDLRNWAKAVAKSQY